MVSFVTIYVNIFVQSMEECNTLCILSRFVVSHDSFECNTAVLYIIGLSEQ